MGNPRLGASIPLLIMQDKSQYKPSYCLDQCPTQRDVLAHLGRVVICWRTIAAVEQETASSFRVGADGHHESSVCYLSVGADESEEAAERVPDERRVTSESVSLVCAGSRFMLRIGCVS